MASSKVRHDPCLFLCWSTGGQDYVRARIAPRNTAQRTEARPTVEYSLVTAVRSDDVTRAGCSHNTQLRGIGEKKGTYTSIGSFQGKLTVSAMIHKTFCIACGFSVDFSENDLFESHMIVDFHEMYLRPHIIQLSTLSDTTHRALLYNTSQNVWSDALT